MRKLKVKKKRKLLIKASKSKTKETLIAAPMKKWPLKVRNNPRKK